MPPLRPSRSCSEPVNTSAIRDPVRHAVHKCQTPWRARVQEASSAASASQLTSLGSTPMPSLPYLPECPPLVPLADVMGRVSSNSAGAVRLAGNCCNILKGFFSKLRAVCLEYVDPVQWLVQCHRSGTSQTSCSRLTLLPLSTGDTGATVQSLQRGNKQDASVRFAIMADWAGESSCLNPTV